MRKRAPAPAISSLGRAIHFVLYTCILVYIQWIQVGNDDFSGPSTTTTLHVVVVAWGPRFSGPRIRPTVRPAPKSNSGRSSIPSSFSPTLPASFLTICPVSLAGKSTAAASTGGASSSYDQVDDNSTSNLDRSDHHNNNNSFSRQNSQPTTSHNQTSTVLWSYVYNLQNARRASDGISSSTSAGSRERGPPANTPGWGRRPSNAVQDDDDDDHDDHDDSSSAVKNHHHHHLVSRNLLLKPARSFTYFLEEQGAALRNSSTRPTNLQVNWDPEPLHRAVIQAVRLAATWDDYQLVLRLARALLVLTDDHPPGGNMMGPLLLFDPRWVTEMVSALTRTSANWSKIYALWKAWVSREPEATLTAKNPILTPLAVNAMMEAAISRQKMGAALNLYYQQDQGVKSRTDAYSVSILLNALSTLTAGEDGSTRRHHHHHLNATAQVHHHHHQADSTLEASLPWKRLETASTVLQTEHLQSLLSEYSWPWNQAVRLLDHAITTRVGGTGPTASSTLHRHWNNAVWTAWLRLNERVALAYPRQHHGAAMALHTWRLLERYQIPPDTVTCTLILSQLGSHGPEALQILRACQKGSEQWPQGALPRPNVYMMSSAMAVCARHGQYHVCRQLLDEIKIGATTTVAANSVRPNTWLYNSVLQALTKGNGTDNNNNSARIHSRARVKHSSSYRREAQERLKWALQLFHEMQNSESNEISPDTVTYNTLFSVLAGTASSLTKSEWVEVQDELAMLMSTAPASWPSEERLVLTLLNQMATDGIPCDAVTYKHALQAVRRCERASIVRILHRAIEDDNSAVRSRLADICHTALASVAGVGDVGGALHVLSTMMAMKCPLDGRVSMHLIRALGQGGRASTLPVLLLAMQGNKDARRHLVNNHGIRLQVDQLPNLDMNHYSAAISACLLASDFESARRVLILMKERGVRPSELSMQEIARAYATVALSTSTGQGSRSSAVSIVTSQARAKSAHTLVSNLSNPPTPLLALVAKACAACSMFDEARALLRNIHERVCEEKYAIKLESLDEKVQRLVSDLHSNLLASCASLGNASVALGFCGDIQHFSRRLAASPEKQPHIKQSTFDVDSLNTAVLAESFDYNEVQLGMKVNDWVSLLIAASKGGYWKVCLSALQFLRPYLETLRPMESAAGDTLRRNQQYLRMTSALTSAVHCLARKGHYAWIVRAVDDWIEWSGRRPPYSAMLVAVRQLAGRGQGNEVTSLLDRCLALNSTNSKWDGAQYEATLHVSAITALYNDGQYDAADDVYVAALSRGILPIVLERQSFGAEKRLTLDLHGQNLAVAHSAVRIALQQEILTASWRRTELWDNDMVIVTGRGRSSTVRMRPVLRPEVQRMLMEEFFPPLSTISVPGNMGALRVPSEDISAWLAHQKEQKGVRMLAVASILKLVSSGDLLRAALSRAAANKVIESNANETEVHP